VIVCPLHDREINTSHTAIYWCHVEETPLSRTGIIAVWQLLPLPAEIAAEREPLLPSSTHCIVYPPSSPMNPTLSTMSFLVRSLRPPLFRLSTHSSASTRPSSALLARAFSTTSIKRSDGPTPPQLYGPGGKAGEVASEYVCAALPVLSLPPVS